MKTPVSRLWSTTLAALLLAAPALAWAQMEDEDVLVRAPGAVPGLMATGGPVMMPLGPLPAPAHGIPPHLVEKLGVPRDVAQRIQDLTFESNEALISIEADLKRAQLRLERLLRAPSPDEGAIFKQVEEVGRTETAVRRNRLGLMVQIKKLLGPDLWQKLEAELGAGHVVKSVKIFRGVPGEEAAPRPGSPPLRRKP